MCFILSWSFMFDSSERKWWHTELKQHDRMLASTLKHQPYLTFFMWLQMTGVLVTYLIILVQFNIGAVHSTNQISADNNIQSSKYIPVQQ